jgi:hypothetical protein
VPPAPVGAAPPAPVGAAPPAPVGAVPPAPVGAAPPAPVGARPNVTPAAGARPAAAKPADLDVCTLVTQPEAEAMLGAPVISHESNPAGCRYAAADGSSVGVDSAGGASAEYSKLMFETTHQVAPTVKDISGLGDKATTHWQATTHWTQALDPQARPMTLHNSVCVRP